MSLRDDLQVNDLDDGPAAPKKKKPKRKLSTYEKKQRILLFTIIAKFAAGGAVVFLLMMGGLALFDKGKQVVTALDVKEKTEQAVQSIDREQLTKDAEDAVEKVKDFGATLAVRFQQTMNKAVGGDEEISGSNYQYMKSSWPRACPDTYAKAQKLIAENGLITKSEHRDLVIACGENAEQKANARDKEKAQRIKQEIIGE